MILVLIFSFTNGEKIVVLATWIIWVLLIIGFLMVIEYMRFSCNARWNSAASATKRFANNWWNAKLQGCAARSVRNKSGETS